MSMMTPQKSNGTASVEATSEVVSLVETEADHPGQLTNPMNLDVDLKGAIVEESLTSPKKSAKPPSNMITRYLFMDDAHPSYFRRLAFSPDGSFLITPAGIFHADELSKEGEEDGGLWLKMKQEATGVLDTVAGGDAPVMSRSSMPTCYVFHRSDGFAKPIAHLPQLDPVVVVKFSPRLWKVRDGEDQGLPYRMVFAVATTKQSENIRTTNG